MSQPSNSGPSRMPWARLGQAFLDGDMTLGHAILNLSQVSEPQLSDET
jgi:hypothetical protein